MEKLTSELKGSGNKAWLVMVACCGMVAATVGLSINASGVFYTPVSDDLGMLRGTFALHMTIFTMVTAFTALVVPAFMERFSFKKIMTPALVVAVVSTFLMGRMSSVPAFFVLGATRGFSTCLFSVVPANMIVGAWFNKSSGTATSIMMASSGIAGALGSSALSGVIAAMGWRNAYTVLAVAIALLSLPALLIPFAPTPEEEGLLPFGGAREANATSGETLRATATFSYASPFFLVVVAATVLMSFVTSIAQHFPGYAESIGLGATGALMVSAAMVGNIVLKLLTGVVADRIGAPKAAIVMSVSCGVGLLLVLLGGAPAVMLAGAFLFGGCYAVGAVAAPLLARYFFGNEQFSRAYPPVNMTGNVGAALSMSAIGYIYDFTQSYAPAFIICLIMAVATITAMLLAGRKEN